MKSYSIALHGGAGTILRSQMNPELEGLYSSALQNSIRTGAIILEKGGTSLDAVEATVVSLEDFPLFNAGKGAVFNHQGRHEMDASIMDGTTLKAGAVSGVSHVQNPVKLARMIMDHSEHVFLTGPEAEEFAKQKGLKLQDDAYFYTEGRYQQWLEIKDIGGTKLDHTISKKDDKKFGTVGCVALDHQGNLAAATSTGGMTNKQFGRVGDSPIIGAGTYANNRTCAISCTGHGEYFIRAVVAYDISCLMEYRGLALMDACQYVVHDKLKKMGGEGGLIAVDVNGNIALPFNSEGMYRAWKKQDGEAQVRIYKD